MPKVRLIPTRPIAERLLTTGIVLAVLLSCAAVLDAIGHARAVRSAYLADGSAKAAEVAETIDTVLRRAMGDAEEMADTFGASSAWNEEAIAAELRARSESNPHILGITVAFEPDTFPGRRLYAPFYDKSKGEVVQIEDAYDYTDEGLETAQWYVRVRDEGAQWVEPYFAEGAQTMVADYGIPFSASGGDDRVLGTVTVTIGLGDFQDLLDSLSLGNTGFGFVVSAEGTFLAHPNGDYVDDKTVGDLAEERSDDELMRIAEGMVGQKTGVGEYQSVTGNQPALLFYHPIPASEWSLGLAYMLSELGLDDGTARRKSLHIALAAGLLLILVMAKVLRVSSLESRRLWGFSGGMSVVLLAGMVFIWIQKLEEHGSDSADEQSPVTSIASLDRFVDRERQRNDERSARPLVIVPTGIQVRELDFLSPYDVSVSVLLWQKFPLDAPVELQRRLLFPSMAPSVDAVQLEEIHRERTRHYELVRWEGQVTVRLPFDYSRYPFDERTIRLQLASPALDQNVLLTPDLTSYALINPGSRPGIYPRIVLPSSTITSSFFHYESINSGLTAGSVSRHRWMQNPQLFYNIVLKRDVLNAFIKNFIIILIVALMLFMILVSTSRQKEGETDISAFGVIQTAAAFFFVLVIAHIDLRSTLDTGSITYMEYFYFIIYFMMLLVVYDIIMFMRDDGARLIQYRDNLIVKCLYWPVFLGASFLVTILHFY